FQANAMTVLEIDGRYEQHGSVEVVEWMKVRLGLRIPVNEIAVQLQPGRSAFFRMELRRKDIIARDRAAERLAVRRLAGNMRTLLRNSIIAVHEIEVT